jgi:glutamate-5-semialdehyde dehydrogenase
VDENDRASTYSPPPEKETEMSTEPRTAPGGDGRGVRVHAQQARAAVPALGRADSTAIDHALQTMANRIERQQRALAAANDADVRAATEAGMQPALLDRLRLDEARLAAMSAQLRSLAEVPRLDAVVDRQEVGGGLWVEERRRPVGVIGANFEARPNVVVDVASQLLKSRNTGVLRTGSAAIGSATALLDHVIAPALVAADLPPDAIQLVRTPGHEAARDLVRHPDVLPLVILRGSGASTRELAELAARHGVRTLAHADGGAVIYVDASADLATALRLVEESVDRFGVCNRLNLLLVAAQRWDEWLPEILATLERLDIAASLPPHDHPLGYEWALDEARERTVTIAPNESAREAALTVNGTTSGLAACIVAEDPPAIDDFLDVCDATGTFVNATPRLLDGFKLFKVPETGINVDRVPGPRGPVTFRDLHLRQFVVRA